MTELNIMTCQFLTKPFLILKTTIHTIILSKLINASILSKLTYIHNEFMIVLHSTFCIFLCHEKGLM